MDKFIIRTKSDAPIYIPSKSIESGNQNQIKSAKAGRENLGNNPVASSSFSTLSKPKEQEVHETDLNGSYNIDTCNSNDDSSDVESASKKVERSRTFRHQWLEEFKWIQNKAGSAYCKVCDVRITNIRSHLIRHDGRTSHAKNVEANKAIPINEHFANPTKVSLDRQVNEAELMLVMFCIMHHLPFALMDFLPNLLRKFCPDSNIAKNIKCGRTKVTSIVKNMLGEKGRQDVVCQLRAQKFSIIIDETTDVSTTKALALVARVFDKKRGLIRDRFLGLLQLVKTDAASIYSTIMDHLNLLNIPLNNLIGLGSDDASVMSGQFTGVQARFKEIIPNLVFINCICHSLHLCASNSCQKLPYSIEKLTRDIFNFFAHSSKRCNELQEFQTYFNIKPHKILGIAQTRWLSLEMVVNRVLKQWDALQLYFVSSSLEDKGTRDHAKKLAQQLANPVNKVYILFLSYVLRIVNKMNLEFQSEQVRIHLIFETMENNYKLILSNFLKPVCFRNVANINEIDFRNEENHLDLSNIAMGSATGTFLMSNIIDEEELLTISVNIKKFYIELAQQIQKRFDFNNPMFKSLSLINPEKLLSESVNLFPLINAFPNLVTSDSEKDEVLDEFKLLTISSHLNNLNRKNVEEFWQKLGELNNSLGEPIYGKLSNFMMSLMSLPHSSAAAERIFSELNQTKFKKTNRLSIDTVDSIMAAKELLTPAERKSISSNKASEVWAPRPEHKLI